MRDLSPPFRFSGNGFLYPMESMRLDLFLVFCLCVLPFKAKLYSELVWFFCLEDSATGLCEVYGSVACNFLRNLDGVSDYMIILHTFER